MLGRNHGGRKDGNSIHYRSQGYILGSHLEAIPDQDFRSGLKATRGTVVGAWGAQVNRVLLPRNRIHTMKKTGQDIKYTQRIIRPSESLSASRAVEMSQHAQIIQLIDLNNLPEALQYLQPQIRALGISNALIQWPEGSNVERCLCEFIRRHGRV